jgi:hypothetical protein
MKLYSVTLVLSVACWGSARAEPPPSPADARAQQLANALRSAVSRDEQERTTTAWTQAALGAVLLPSGIVLNSRADPEARLIGIGFVVGGSIQLLTAPLLLIPSSLQRVGNHFDEMAGAGTPKAV